MLGVEGDVVPVVAAVVVGRVVSTSSGDWGLWAARSEASSTLALASLDRLLAIGGLVLLACFGVASWLLASAALRPVRLMRERAETLGAESRDGGLPVGAFGGREAIMRRFDPRSPGYLGHGGTFNANPATMAAREVSAGLAKHAIQGLRFYTPRVHASLFAWPAYAEALGA